MMKSAMCTTSRSWKYYNSCCNCIPGQNSARSRKFLMREKGRSLKCWQNLEMINICSFYLIRTSPNYRFRMRTRSISLVTKICQLEKNSSMDMTSQVFKMAKANLGVCVCQPVCFMYLKHAPNNNGHPKLGEMPPLSAPIAPCTLTVMTLH